MKKLLMLMVVLTMCLALPVMAATTVLYDNFDSHTDGVLTGQSAPTGQTWAAWASYTSNDVGSAYGRTGKGAAMAVDWSDRLNKIPLGTTLTGADDEETVVLSFNGYREFTGAYGSAADTRQQVRIEDTVSGNYIQVRWQGIQDTYNSGIQVEGLGFSALVDSYRSGWVNFELKVNLSSGAIILSWYDIDNSDNKGSYYIGSFDTGTYAFAPDGVSINQRKVAVPSMGLDNLTVKTIHEPTVVVLDEDFDDYTDGDLDGQTATNGQVWDTYSTYYGQVGSGDQARSGKGIAPVAGDWKSAIDDLSLGMPLSPSGDNDTVVLSFDAYRSGGTDPSWTPETRHYVRLTDSVNTSSSIEVFWGGAQGGTHDIKVAGLGLDATLGAYATGWLRFELRVNLSSGASQLSWYDMDVPGNGAVYDLGSFNTTTYPFAPDGLRMHQRRVNCTTVGMDNVIVEMIPAPTGSLVIVESDGSTDSAESATASDDSFTVALGSAPDANVVVAISSGSLTGDAPLYSPDELTFTPTNWSTAQDVDIQAADDEVIEGSHTDTITLSTESTDLDYDLLFDTQVTVNVTDNEIVIGLLGTYVDANDTDNTDSAGAWLAAGDPCDNLWQYYTNVDLTNGNGYLAYGSENAPEIYTTLTGLTASTDYDVYVVYADSWHTYRMIQAGFTSGSLDEFNIFDGVSRMYYDGIHADRYQALIGTATSDGSGDLVVYVDDDDVNDLNVRYDGVAYQLSKIILNKTILELEEGGASDSFTVKLNKAPISDVVVTITEYISPGDVEEMSSVTLNSYNWSVGLTVPVTATDDSDSEAAKEYTYLVLDANSPGDSYFDGHRTIVTVGITDNECGSGSGYPGMDFNDDCYVNFEDFADFAIDWMDCTVPGDPACN